MTSPLSSDDRTPPSEGAPRRGLIRDALHLGSHRWSLRFMLVSFLGLLLGEIDGLPFWLRVVCALLPVVPLVMYLRSILRDTAEIDELAMHVRREAYGFVFCATLGVLVCVHLLERTGLLPGFVWGTTHLIVMMTGLLIVGAVISSRRFR